VGEGFRALPSAGLWPCCLTAVSLWIHSGGKELAGAPQDSSLGYLRSEKATSVDLMAVAWEGALILVSEW
jgi:hypothetical protein